MRFLIRNLFPFCYFQSSRLNSLRFAVYHLLLEWIPAALLALYFNPQEPRKLITLLLSYSAFISIYEIGYITNDFFSERFEIEPRGRLTDTGVKRWIVLILIGFRLSIFASLTFVLHVEANLLWWAFYVGLATTFTFHNYWHSDNRISSFFGLSVFRFIAPLIIVVPTDGLIILVPIVMLHYSLYRTITYGDGKGLVVIGQRNTFRFKLVHYLNIVPLSVLFGVILNSPVPVYFCGYYMVFWGFSYFVMRQKPFVSGTDL